LEPILMPQRLIESFDMIWTAFRKTEDFRLSSTVSSPTFVIRFEYFKDPRVPIRKFFYQLRLKPCPLQNTRIRFRHRPTPPFACVQTQCSDPKQESESERQNCDLQQGNVSFFHQGYDWRARRLRDSWVTAESRSV
jgi:hypothetical protein